MTTVNRLKNKSKLAPKTSKQQQQAVSTSVIRSQSSIKSIDEANQDQRIYNESSHCPAEQQYYQGFSELSLSNPNGVAATCSIFPHSMEMNNNFNIPLAFIMSPLLFLQNQHAQSMNKCADQIPRCSVCRAYMNCFNKVDKKKFTCFLCNRDSYFEHKNKSNEDNDEFSTSIYQALSPSSFSSKQPSQQAFIFMVDISQDPFISKMLYYATAAIKQVLSREDLDDILIYFFTFDQLIHYYEFTGNDVKCTIYDGSIQIGQNNSRSILKDIRQNLFVLLDNLDEISKNNPRKGYNFSKSFNLVFSSLKHIGGKFFIFQSNQQIKNQQAVIQRQYNPNCENNKKSVGGYNSRSQSFYQTNNKQFFNTYAEDTIKYQCSMSMFCFASNFKNIRIFADVFKISSSELKLYSKDATDDLDRFYYDLSYLLGATYFRNILVEFIVSAGWVLLGIYGNYHRIKDTISFQINSIQPTRKIVAIVSPSPNTKKLSPFCCMQMITNYKYKNQSFIAISTIVQPVTGYTQKLYRGINPLQTITAIAKKFLSTLRMEPVFQVRRKTIQIASKIYINALNTFKKQQKIPDNIFTVVLSILAMLKSGHCHPELINGTPTFDRIISERNILQFAGPSEVANRFNPYLFDLTHIDESMCNLDEDFIYPPTLQLKFRNVKSGIYLLDNGLSLTLFIGKQCDPNILSQLLGKSKIKKNWKMEERQLLESNSEKANKVANLITFLRQQKSYGWIPLHIVKCGENTENEKKFYLNFFGEKYEQFKEYGASFEEFIAFISKASY